MTHLPDPALIAQLQDRDLTAYAKLYNLYEGHLYGIIIRFIKDPEQAKTILIKTLVEAWINIEKFNPMHSTLFSWLLQLTIHTLSSHHSITKEQLASLRDYLNKLLKDINLTKTSINT